MILNYINCIIGIIGILLYKINLKTSGIGSAGEEKQAMRSFPPAESYLAYRCKNKNSIIDKTIYTMDYIDT